MRPGRACMRILFVSHTPDTSVFKVGSHHYARALAAAGHRVVHLSTPTSPLHLARLRDASMRARVVSSLKVGSSDDTFGVTHVYPLCLLPLKWRVSPRTWTLQACAPGLVGRVAKELGASADVIVLDQSEFAGLERLLPAKRIIFRPTDLPRTRYERAAFQTLARSADAVVATSHDILGSLAVPGIVFSNGVDFEHFQKAAPSSSRRGAVYVGAVDERFDAETLLLMADSYPNEPFTVAGPGSEALPSRPNLRRLGPVDYDAIPDLLKAHAVGLLPFHRSAMNDARSPMKYYEYLAAGLTVVASDTSALRRMPAPGVWRYRDGADAVNALMPALSAGVNQAGIVAASREDWSHKVPLLEAVLRGDSSVQYRLASDVPVADDRFASDR